MRTPTQRTLINLAVASACALLAMPGHAQQQAAAGAAGEAAPAQGASGAQEATSVQEAAAAQEPATGASAQPTTVVQVSGTRIAARGFTQPTPTTSLSTADLERAAKPNLFNTLAELPALQGSTGRTTSTNSTSSGIQGLSSLSLRGLGTIRTLTLLDGQRVVGANVTGVTDVSQFPQLLVKRVDVVTGGASASYGSDAIGGAVNFITDKKFKGFKVNVEGGQTKYHDDEHGTLQAAWGGSFAGDRLHGEVLVVLVGGLAVFDIGLEAFELGVGDEVDHAADGIRPIRRGSAARDHVDALHQQLRELAHVGHAGDVRAHHALPVQ